MKRFIKFVLYAGSFSLSMVFFYLLYYAGYCSTYGTDESELPILMVLLLVPFVAMVFTSYQTYKLGKEIMSNKVSQEINLLLTTFSCIFVVLSIVASLRHDALYEMLINPLNVVSYFLLILVGGNILELKEFRKPTA